MSRADGDYSVEEQKAVKKAAKLLKVEHEYCTCPYRLIETEESVTGLRKSLLKAEVLA